MSEKEYNFVIFGAGAIGSSIGAWLYPHYDKVCFLDRKEIAEEIKEKGINIYLNGEKEKIQKINVPVIQDLKEKPDTDVVILATKNYSLDAVAQEIKSKLGDPIIIALQNGVENQTVLPKYFSKVIYGTICWNAWKDSASVLGFSSWQKPVEGKPKTGSLFLGTVGEKNPELEGIMKDIVKIFSKGFDATISDDFQNTIHTKMVTNLGNCVLTLAGHKFREISSMKTLAKITTNVLNEGVQILKAAGYSEYPMDGVTSWGLVGLGAKLPASISKLIFQKKVRHYPMNSMAQDILQQKGTQSELDYFNGYFLELAKKVGVKAPYNQGIYDTCKEEFAKPNFEPLDVAEIWDKIKVNL